MKPDRGQAFVRQQHSFGEGTWGASPETGFERELRLEFLARVLHRYSMRALLLALSGLAVATSALRAADDSLGTLRVGSEVYSNVIVTGHSPTVLYLQHARGVGSVKLKDLSPDLQRKYGYDAAKAQAVEAQQRQAQVDYVKELARQPKPEIVPEPAADQEAEPALAGHVIYAKPFVNQRAPDLVVEKWLTEPPDLTNRFRLVTFWATWSEPCRRAIARLKEIHRKYGDKIAVIALSVEPEEQVRELAYPKLEFASAIDTRKRMIQAVEVTAIPHSLLIDPQGIVRFEGVPDLFTDEVLDRVLSNGAR